MRIGVVCGLVLSLIGFSSESKNISTNVELENPVIGTLNETITGIGNFSIRQDFNAILLTWEALQLDDILFFEIERSIDSENFVQIGIVASKPTPSNGIYSYRDKIRLYGSRGYYRLKAKDARGNSYQSNVLEWKSGKLESLELKPNFADNILTVKVPDPFSNGTLIVKSVQGEVLFRKHLVVRNLDNYIFLVSELPVGLALVCLEQGNQIWSKLIMVYN